MTSLAQLLGDPYYDRFEAAARQLAEQSRQLSVFLQAGKARPEAATTTMPQAAALAERLSVRALRASATGMERENIEAIAKAFSRIARTLEKCERYRTLIPDGGLPIDLAPLAKLLEAATQLLATFVGRLRVMTGLDCALELRTRFQAFETESDRLSTQGLRDLLGGQIEASTVVALKELIDLLDQAVGDCCAAAELIWLIFLENN